MEAPLTEQLSHETKYNAAVTALGIEVQTFWTVNQTYLLGATILAGFLLQTGADRGLLYKAGTILGILVGLLWIIALSRSTDYHKLRALHVRELENGATDGFMTRGEAFRVNNQVEVAGVVHRASLMGRLPLRGAGIGLAWGFFGFFIIVFARSL
jgi:hypothetical protein